MPAALLLFSVWFAGRALTGFMNDNNRAGWAWTIGSWSFLLGAIATL